MSRKILLEPNNITLFAGSINTDSLTVNDVNYNLPDTDGTNGQVLTTNGSGNLTFQNSGGSSNISTFQLNSVLGFTKSPASPIVEAISGTHIASTLKTLVQSVIPVRAPGPISGRMICIVYINGVNSRPYDGEIELSGLTTSMITTFNILFTHDTIIGQSYSYSIRIQNQMSTNSSTGGFEAIYRTLVLTSV